MNKAIDSATSQNRTLGSVGVPGVGGQGAFNHLTAALERGRETYSRVRQKIVARAKVTDEVIRRHPYRAIGIGLGLGVLLGCVVGRWSRNSG